MTSVPENFFKTPSTSVPKISDEKSRNWCFTLNNFTEAEMTHIHDPPDWVKYIAYEKEVGKEGTPHIQGYLVANNPVRLKSWKAFLRRAHVEVMRGSLDQNEAYCSKEGKFTEVGSRPAQGRRTDLIDAKRKLDEGIEPMELAQNEQYFGTVMRHERFFEKYAAFKRRKLVSHDRTEPCVYVRIGPTGTGKTRWLDDTFGLGSWAFCPDNSGKWFDHCHSYDVVVFDDVKVNEIPPISQFKKLLDRYPLPVAIKGGFATWKPKHIIITANSAPGNWWTNPDPLDMDAIQRRINKIIFVGDNGDIEESITNPHPDLK